MKGTQGLFICCALLAVVLLAATFVTIAALSGEVRIPGTGNIVAVNVKVYTNSACTTELVTINWGSLAPGESKQVTCCVKSLSTVSTTLSLGSGNFNSTQANQYLSLSWNRQSYSAEPGEVVSATLTLHVDQAVQGFAGFSFDCIITASGG